MKKEKTRNFFKFKKILFAAYVPEFWLSLFIPLILPFFFNRNKKKDKA